MSCEILKKDPDQKGFVVLNRRWVVERTFGWITRAACCASGRCLNVVTGRLVCVACLVAANALNNPVLDADLK